MIASYIILNSNKCNYKTTGPRWGQPWHPQPWVHPGPPFQGPHFRPEFRPPMGPWQNHPRMPFGPMRPDFSHPQFHGFNPRLAHPGMNPNGPMIMPNGPHNNIAANNSVSPMTNLMGTATPPAPGTASMMSGSKKQTAREVSESNNSSDANSSWTSSNNNDNKGSPEENVNNFEEVASNISSDELPSADPELLEKISKDTMLSISIDNVPREIRYYGETAIIFMRWDDPRDIGFQNGARRILIDGAIEVVCSFNDDYREFTHEGEVHK